MTSRLLAILLLTGCGFAAAERREARIELIAQNPATGQILLFGSGPEYEAFAARLDRDAIVDAREIPAQRVGNLEGVWIGPDGTIRLANAVGEDFELLESRDARSWTYPRMFTGSFGSFHDDGSFSYLAGPSNRDQPLHVVSAAGEDREVVLGENEQTPALCGDVAISSDGYEMHRIELRDAGAAITDSWTLDGRNEGYLPSRDELIVDALQAVYRLRAGKSEPEIVRRHQSGEYGALADLAVDADGNIVFVHHDEKRFEFHGNDGARVELPLSDQLRGPAGGGSIYRCHSNAFLRRGDQLYVAQGTLAVIGIRDSSIRFITVPPISRK
jgi:hypothetical protein